jgi:hypothetical protein
MGNQMKWKYHSENLGGNLHSAAKFISDNHPEWDVVAMSCSGFNTVVVWREELRLKPSEVFSDTKLPKNITTKNGLLYRDDVIIDLPEADRVAGTYGFMCAEQLVKALEARDKK